MSAEPVTSVRPQKILRSDGPAARLPIRSFWPWVVLVILGGGFVLVGGASLDLGATESRVGLSVGERLGPFGQLYGGWKPGVWPGQVAPAMLWARVEGGIPTPGSVRWPSAIAGLIIGVLMARRVMNALGARASLAWGLCWFGSVALIDRSGGTGVDLITGLATVGALDRVLNRGSQLAAGLWASLAFLAAGWPPLALIGLTIVVIGRQGKGVSVGLVLLPLLTFAAWSAWAMSVAPTEAWAAALTLPLTDRPAWWMAAGVVALGLPWSPFASLAAFRSVREAWSPNGRALVVGWLQVAGASLVAGTVVPGLATAARIPALVGISLGAAACLEQVATRPVPTTVRRYFLTLSSLVVGLWTAIVLVRGVVLASEVSYYRGLSIVLMVWVTFTLLAAVLACTRSASWRGLAALVAVAISLKLAHWGFYVPEWNYRHGKGPWGRAVGQWVLPHWTIYTDHTWPTDLAFAIGRPIRQLPHPRHLVYQKGPNPKFVLLFQSEFDNWPAEAPPLLLVARFQDEWGGTRVLARTEGDASWRRLARASREE
jgi:hypothetical protein